MALKELLQNKERYRVSPTEWSISASPRIAPIRLPIGGEVGRLSPVIKSDGIVLKLIQSGSSDSNLVSPTTLSDISDSRNPHYTSGVNGTVRGAVMGKSVPVIRVDASRLTELAAAQAESNAKAGVRDAIYIFEGDVRFGVPVRMLQQIDWTLTAAGARPYDEFQLWNVQLRGDYSVQQLVIETAQSGSKVDLDKLARLMEGVNDRVNLLREDFNTIKDIFYNGKVPPNTLGWRDIKKLASADGTESGPTDEQVIFKTSTTVANVPPPSLSGVSTPTATPAATAVVQNPIQAATDILNLLSNIIGKKGV